MAEMLKLMVESVGPTPILTEIRLLAVSLLAFADFMCCVELVKLLCKNVVLNDEGLVNIHSSKTDQLRDGANLVIACTGQHHALLPWMQRYYSMDKIDVPPNYSVKIAVVFMPYTIERKICKC